MRVDWVRGMRVRGMSVPLYRARFVGSGRYLTYEDIDRVVDVDTLQPFVSSKMWMQDALERYKLLRLGAGLEVEELELEVLDADNKVIRSLKVVW
jgi:hypothetical protein